MKGAVWSMHVLQMIGDCSTLCFRHFACLPSANPILKPTKPLRALFCSSTDCQVRLELLINSPINLIFDTACECQTFAI